MPRSIVLIIDYSASQLPFIRTSIESAKQLVDKLNPKDRMAIVTDDVRLLVDFTTDKQLLKSRLEGLKASALAGNVGASDQFDALMATLTEIFNNADIRPIVIFQTDGDEFDDLRGNAPPTRFWLPARFSFQNVLTAAEKSRVTIYPVISGIRYAAVPEAELVERALNDWLNRQSAGEELMRARKQPLPKDRTRPHRGRDVNEDQLAWAKEQAARANENTTLPVKLSAEKVMSGGAVALVAFNDFKTLLATAPDDIERARQAALIDDPDGIDGQAALDPKLLLKTVDTRGKLVLTIMKAMRDFSSIFAHRDFAECIVRTVVTELADLPERRDRILLKIKDAVQQLSGLPPEKT